MEIENITVDYPCPECKLRFPVRLRQLGEGGVVICPRCRASNAENQIREIENLLENIGQSIQNLKNSMENTINLKPEQ